MVRGPFRGLGFSEPSEFSRPPADDPDDLGTSKPKKKRKPDYITDAESLLEQEP